MDESPQLVLAKTVRIPQCSLVVLNTRCMATEDHVGQLYRVRTNHILQNNYPNLTMLSTVHRIDELVTSGIPLVVINMGVNDIWLSKETVMAHLDVEEVDISEVTTQTIYDSGYESDNDEKREKDSGRPMLSSFITLPADIETHWKGRVKR